MNKKKLFGKKVLCFGTSYGYNRQRFLKEAVEEGLDLKILKFPGESFLIDFPFDCIEVHPRTIEEDLNELASEEFDCAITYEEFHVERMSKIAPLLKLKRPLPSLETALKSRDKILMKKAFEEKGIPIAEWSEWSSSGELGLFLYENGLCPGKFVLKPRAGTTSAGVYRSVEHETMDQAVKNFLKMCESCGEEEEYAALLSPPFIVERFLHRDGKGVELAVDGYVHDGKLEGILISEKIDMKNSGPFLENKYLSPPISDYIIKDQEKVREISERVVKAVGINNLAFHLELRYDNGDIKVLEIASRPGGGLISESAKERLGISYRRQHLLLSLGLEPEKIEMRNVGTCFGTLYFEEDFKLENFDSVIDFLGKNGLYYEVSPHLNKRKYIIHDGLLAFGVAAENNKNAYLEFYSNLEKIKSILRS